MDKYKYEYEVLETMEWRNKEFQPGQIIKDTDNTYMKAMVYQGKLKKLN